MKTIKKNHERYQAETPTTKKRRTLISYLIGDMNYKIVAAALSPISGKKVLELGAGSGRFTKLYSSQNRVKCIDINPHLFTLPDVPIVKADAAHFSSVLKATEKFDYILSFFMMEYINKAEARSLLDNCSKHLIKDGTVMLTFISCGLLGRFYTRGARMKGIKKYKYTHKEVLALAQAAGLSYQSHKPITRFMCEMGKLYEFKKT